MWDMLIRFAVSNFLSFDGMEELSLEAGKTRKNSDRLYTNRRLKLVKCEAMFGANASGKSNLVEALRFVQNMVEDGFPIGFSNKYYPSYSFRLYYRSLFLYQKYQSQIITKAVIP